jgi:hypothetical protein
VFPSVEAAPFPAAEACLEMFVMSKSACEYPTLANTDISPKSKVG